jgi:hypothetical protein
MQNKAVRLLLVASLCCGVVGCAQSASDIASSYGVMNSLGFNEKAAAMFESGQADALIESGQARVSHSVRGDTLVTEYVIAGEVYRVEVRKQIDPTEGVAYWQVHWANAVEGLRKKHITGFQMASVWNILRDNSYEARAEIAFRSYKDSEGRTHRVRAEQAPRVEWLAGENAENLYIRTSEQPVSQMWFQNTGNSDSGTGTWCPTDVFQSGRLDARWTTVSPGPGKKTPAFINLKLQQALGL